MTDLNIALILKLVDQATGPAREALRNVERVSDRLGQRGLAQLEMADQLASAQRARVAGLAAESAALAGVGFGIYKALQPAVEFEKAMDSVGEISRSSEDDLIKLTAAAQEFGATTPFSARQSAEAMEFLAMSGFDANSIIAATPGLLNLASASQLELGRTADIASNVLTGFQRTASDMNEVGDVLTNTYTSSNTTLSMLGATMAEVAPNAVAVGADIATVAGMAGKLGDNGIQGSRAGTALRAIMVLLAAPTGEAAKALEGLNVQTADAEGNVRPMVDILSDMDSAMQGMGSAARSDIMATVFGLEAVSAATVLVGEAGSGSLANYIATLNEAGSTARVAEGKTANAAGSMTRLSSASEALAIAAGTALIPALTELVEAITPYIQAAANWAQANPELIEQIGYIAAGLFAMKAASVVARFAFEPFISMAILAVRGFGYLNVALGLAGRSLALLGRGLGKLAGLRAINLSRLVRPLAWTARLIPAISWAGLAGALRWRSLIRPLVWAARAGVRFIPVIGWAVLAGELLWNLLIKPLGWDEFIPDVDWGYWFRFEWVDKLPRWDWSAIIPSIDIASFFSGPVAAGSVGRQQTQPSIIVGDAEYIRPAGSGGRRSGGSSNVSVGEINVHPAPGMDERAIAREVSRQIKNASDQSGALHDGGLHD